MDKETKSLEYTITVVVNRDNIPESEYGVARNRIEQWVSDGMQHLSKFLMIDPDLPDEGEDLPDHVNYCYVSKACLEQTYGDR